MVGSLTTDRARSGECVVGSRGSLVAMSSADFERLRRWEGAGGSWRIRARGPGWVEIALLSCTLGEEMDRVRSSDPDVFEYVSADESGDSEPKANTGASNS